MREMTCIICPNGCTLLVEERDGSVIVTGNKCKRGEAFAMAELKHPMRTICTTVRTIFPEVPVIPVRVSSEIPKASIFEVMEEINRTVVSERVGRGNILISNILGLKVDVVVTSGILLERKKGKVEGEERDEYETI